ncbi:PKD domain-containing protein [Mongoliitalea daihaiensis]|uniref:PKD domain-containing protein n=1 Tax=Mongoliitalea daihaiensis TaxID=2782006 RepID=UPI001F314FA0|nr:PKD domain-containing protein [Mongoliitalea daihaiensis]
MSLTILLISFKSNAQLSTVGKEFWLGFMENNRVIAANPANSSNDVGIIIITAEETSSGVIQYATSTINFSLNPGEQFIHRILNFDILHRTSGVVENKGVFISSSGNIAVHAFNERFRSADGTVILPVSALGKDHYITSHYEFMSLPLNYNPNINDESLLLVVATEDNTRVEITPTVFTLSGNAPNNPFTITLNKGQSYQIKAQQDLTGTRVRVVGDNADDCKNIAVFGGNKWTSVGECGSANDHLYQQTYPISTWGTAYVHVPLAGRSSGELVKVLASENNTSVSVNGTQIATLNAGQARTILFGREETAFIETSKPSAVTVFSKSQQCNDVNQPFFQNGDPFMITYSPTNQRLSSLTFNAIQLPSITQHFVTIIVPSDAVNQTVLDGSTAIGNQFQAIPGTDFSFARPQINQGVHRLENPQGFIAYVYGFGEIESYGYSAGAKLENLNFEIEPQYDFEVEGSRIACLNQEGLWEIFPENDLFTYFLWDFGDGSPIEEGKIVDHIFESPGTYEVAVIAALSPNSCDEQQTIRFEVRVLEILGEIIGPSNACPETDEITYSFQTDSDFSKIEFNVEGGTITSVDEASGQVTVLWGSSNPSAKVLAKPFTLEGCPGDTIELMVSINQVIDSSLPTGSTKICYNPNSPDTYSIQNPLEDRMYEWFVTGGIFVNGNISSTVDVQWTNPGEIGELWYTEVSTLDNLCAGESPKLQVVVNPLLTASLANLELVSCFGGSDGVIELNVQGGTAPYTFRWSHDSILNAPKAEDLSAGTYEVQVIDDLGCEIVVESIEIAEPDLLEIISITTEPTSCFGKDDGEARITIQGGTAPFSINFPNAFIQGNELFLNDLEGTSYSLEISDANGCTIPLLFDINSPLPLEVGVRIIRPACPGQFNGELLAEPTGDFSPFIFSWDFDNGTDAILSNIPKGTYTVTVRNQSGCVSVGTADMIEARPQVRMPTGFKPSDGEYMGVSNCDLSFNLKVINRWGQLVYSGDTGWNGLIDNSPAPLGSYGYVFTYNYLFEGELVEEEIKGIVTLIR